MTPKAFTALVFFIAGLLAVVVIVGLILQTLDTTGVALALVSMLGGVVGGAILRSRNQNGGGDR